jgi:hypothetical protein
MNNGGVASAGTGGHIALFFQYGDFQIGTGKFTGNGTANGTRAHDQYVKFLFHHISPLSLGMDCSRGNGDFRAVA